jgi:hypothetical protein
VNGFRVVIVLVLLLLLISVAVMAGGLLRPNVAPAAVWTPAPLPGEATAPGSDAILPTIAPPEDTQAPDVVEQAPAPVGVPTQARRQVPAATAAGPRKVIVTDADMAQSINSGVAGQNGVQAQNLQVHFTGGRVRITADQVSYSMIQVSNLVLVGRLVARNGALDMETESVSPGGLVTAMIPAMVNQGLHQYSSKWYVEDVQTGEGQIELTVR